MSLINSIMRPLALAAAPLVIPALAVAQSVPTTPWSAAAGVGFESYSFGEAEQVGIRSLSLATTPFAARVRVFGDAGVTVSGAYARGALERSDGSTATLSGLTDTNVQLDVPIGRDLVVLSAVAALPTGHSTHTAEEAEVAGAIAADLLPFRVSNWGTGGGFGFATAVARTVGDFGIGLSVGYSLAREFEPLAEDERGYLPGNELRLRAAIDRSFGQTGKLSLQLTANRYGEDELGGQNLYRSGDRLSALASYSFATGPAASAVLYGGVLHRSEGSYLDLSREAAAQDLLLAGGGARMPLGGNVLLPSVDVRVFRSADGVGQGYSTGLGGSLEMPMSGMMLVPSLRGRFGTVLVREGAESGFTGFDAGLTVRFGARR